MNTLLAKVEHGAAQFNRMVGDYFAFFKNKQNMFEGIKKTFKLSLYGTVSSVVEHLTVDQVVIGSIPILPPSLGSIASARVNTT